MLSPMQLNNVHGNMYQPDWHIPDTPLVYLYINIFLYNTY